MRARAPAWNPPLPSHQPPSQSRPFAVTVGIRGVCTPTVPSPFPQEGWDPHNQGKNKRPVSFHSAPGTVLKALFLHFHPVFLTRALPGSTVCTRKRRQAVCVSLARGGRKQRQARCVSLARGAHPVHFRAGLRSQAPSRAAGFSIKNQGVKYDMLCGPHRLPQLPHSAATLPKQPQTILNRWADLAFK